MSIDHWGCPADGPEPEPGYVLNLRQRIRELEAENEDLRGRALGIDSEIREAIRALLRSELTAGELRRALGELIR